MPLAFTQRYVWPGAAMWLCIQVWLSIRTELEVTISYSCKGTRSLAQSLRSVYDTLWARMSAHLWGLSPHACTYVCTSVQRRVRLSCESHRASAPEKHGCSLQKLLTSFLICNTTDWGTQNVFGALFSSLSCHRWTGHSAL